MGAGASARYFLRRARDTLTEDAFSNHRFVLHDVLPHNEDYISGRYIRGGQQSVWTEFYDFHENEVSSSCSWAVMSKLAQKVYGSTCFMSHLGVLDGDFTPDPIPDSLPDGDITVVEEPITSVQERVGYLRDFMANHSGGFVVSTVPAPELADAMDRSDDSSHFLHRPSHFLRIRIPCAENHHVTWFSGERNYGGMTETIKNRELYAVNGFYRTRFYGDVLLIESLSPIQENFIDPILVAFGLEETDYEILEGGERQYGVLCPSSPVGDAWIDSFLLRHGVFGLGRVGAWDASPVSDRLTDRITNMIAGLVWQPARQED